MYLGATNFWFFSAEVEKYDILEEMENSSSSPWSGFDSYEDVVKEIYQEMRMKWRKINSGIIKNWKIRK